MLKKIDNIYFGLVVAIILPLLTSFGLLNGGMAYLRSLHLTRDSVALINQDQDLLGLALQFGALINLIPFFICNSKYYIKGMRGTVLGTLVYFIFVFVYSMM